MAFALVELDHKFVWHSMHQALFTTNFGAAMLYFLIKFIHIASAIVWIGSILTVSFLHLRIAQTKDIKGLAFLSRYSLSVGRYVVGPAATLTVLAGASLSLFFGFGWPLWVIWALAAIVLTAILEGKITRKTEIKINKMVRQDLIDYPYLNALQRKYNLWNFITILILFSVVAVMVFKPT